MRTSAWIFYLIAAYSCAATAAEPRIGRMTAYELPEYTIYTTRGSAQARQFATELAKFRGTLEKLLGKRAAQVPIPTHLVILSRGEWEKYLQPRKLIAGWFQQGLFSNVIVMDGDAGGEQSTHLVFHEYTHYYLSSQFAGEYPPWFHEGLAELMGYARFRKGNAILLIPDHLRQQARTGDWIPFERLIRVDQSSPEYISHKLADNFYAQSWLTVHYGMLENRDFGRRIFDYLTQLNRLIPHDRAAREAFGDLAAIDQQLREYSRSSRMNSGGMALDDIPEVSLPEPRVLTELEALTLIADLMLDTRQPPERTRPVVESLTRRLPESAHTSILTARLADFEDKYAEFDAAAQKAEAQLADGDWQGRRELASLLLMSVAEFRPLVERSREQTNSNLTRALRWFGEAIQHNPRDIEALWGFGTAAVHLNTQLDAAEQALVSAYQLAPGNPQIAVSLANLMGQQEKHEEMVVYLKDAIRFATDLGTRQWANETLKQMERFIAERDALEEENRRQREAYEKQLAEYEKRFGKRKKKAAQ
jgi:tetratricopeptide (TPR) repeat protein